MYVAAETWTKIAWLLFGIDSAAKKNEIGPTADPWGALQTLTLRCQKTFHIDLRNGAAYTFLRHAVCI